MDDLLSPEIIAKAVAVLVPMILSLTLHEYAHAWAARRLGDDTAEQMGRLTLNPIAHIDPIGTIVLPLLLLLFGGGFFFGWAKPVPFNPMRFSRRFSMRTGAMLVAAAGPLSNLILAFLAAAFYSALLHSGAIASVPEPAQALIVSFLFINIALFVFNMIPVYPLDGQKVVSGLLSAETAIRYERFNAQFGTLLLMGIIVFGRNIIAVPFSLVQKGVLSLVGLA